MPRFAPAHLTDLAGETAFSRGEAYRAAGAVTILSADAELVLAEVRGTQLYRVRLRGSDPRPSGHCTCPAYAREGWCKHLVAVALAVNAAPEGLPDRRAAIRAHLQGLGVEELANMLLDLAERDEALWRRLNLNAGAAALPPADRAWRLREALRDALDTDRFNDEGDGAEWVAEVGAVLDQVPGLIAGGAAGEAKDLLDALLDDLPRAVEMMSDDADAGLGLLERAAALHLDACRAGRPDPATLAGELFERAVDDAFGTFRNAAEAYAEVLGEAGLAAYRGFAERAWAALPPPDRHEGWETRSARNTLAGLLDRFAERQGDLDRRIALRRATTASAHEHLALARFCLEHGRAAEAMTFAAEGARLPNDHGVGDAVAFLAERLLAEGRRDEALAVVWEGFGRAPGGALFKTLAMLEGDGATDRALSVLRSAGVGGLSRLDLELDILMQAGQLAEAWEVARQRAAPEHLVLRLAAASEATLPDEASQAYRGLIRAAAERANRSGYEEACRLLARLAPLEAPEAHAAFVAGLRLRHRTKRTLLPMLDQHLATLATAA